MSRYIDAEALYKQTEEWEQEARTQVRTLDNEERLKWSIILTERTAFKHDVMDFPAADVVEVVRCKDCEYSERYEVHGDVWRECGHPLTSIEFLDVEEDGFCKWGERRDE